MSAAAAAAALPAAPRTAYIQQAESPQMRCAVGTAAAARLQPLHVPACGAAPTKIALPCEVALQPKVLPRAAALEGGVVLQKKDMDWPTYVRHLLSAPPRTLVLAHVLELKRFGKMH